MIAYALVDPAPVPVDPWLAVLRAFRAAVAAAPASRARGR